MKKLSAAATAALLTNMSFLISVGLTPLEAAENLSKPEVRKSQKKKDKVAAQMAKAAESLISKLQSGSSISEAFANHEEIFGSLYRQVEAGERSGNMADALKRIAKQLSEGNKMRGKIQGALVYPVLLIVVALISTIYLFGKLLPTTFQVMQESVSLNLPGSTKAIMNMTTFLQHNGLIILAVLTAATVIVVYLAKGPQKENAHEIYSKLGIVGRVVCDNSMKTYYDSLNYMLYAGVALDEAMMVAANSVNNLFIRHQLIDAASLYARTGLPLNEVLATVDAITNMELASITAGYRSDHLKDVLVDMAAKRRESLDQRLTIVVSLVEPVAITFAAIIIGIVVLAVYPPLMNVGSSSQLTTF